MSKNIVFTDEELRDYEANKGRMHGALLCKMLLEQREENRWTAKQYDAMLAERNAALLQIDEAKADYQRVHTAWKMALDAQDEIRTAGINLAKVLTKERDDANRLIERMTNSLNKIHDLAGQTVGSDFINTQMGSIQDWVHQVLPCKEQQTERPKCVCQGGSCETGCMCGCHFGLGKTEKRIYETGPSPVRPNQPEGPQERKGGQ